jgi:glycosyltransferase involved in cell wall biosynthesis
MMSIVIPAHNESQVLGRLLAQLVPYRRDGELDIVVVANGCTDATAEVAASFGPPVRVLSIPVASKSEALAAGNRAAKGFPRLYVDADVELRAEDAYSLAKTLALPGVFCAGPQREHAMAGRSRLIRWYYEVWTQLPEVQRGLFGRGVVGVSAAGYRRIAELPPLLADDLAASLAFAPEERAIVPNARVIIHPPRTFADLLRSRARATMGANQIEQTGCALRSTARTRLPDLLLIASGNPRMAPRVALYMVVAILAKRKARRLAARLGYTAWLRDTSSRESAMVVGS